MGDKDDPRWVGPPLTGCHESEDLRRYSYASSGHPAFCSQGLSTGEGWLYPGYRRRCRSRPRRTGEGSSARITQQLSARKDKFTWITIFITGPPDNVQKIDLGPLQCPRFLVSQCAIQD